MIGIGNDSLQMTRKPLTRVEFARLLIAQEGKCAMCGAKLTAENIHDDHWQALALGGGNELDNRRLICSVPCHREKTSGSKSTSLGSDIHAVAKIKRLTGEKKQKRKIPSRPFARRTEG